MSIESTMQPFTLQQNFPEEDRLGTLKDNYVTIDTFDASISYNTLTSVDNGLAYTITEPTAITRFRSFDRGEEYKLLGAEEYKVISINLGGRYTQLILREVI